MTRRLAPRVRGKLAGFMMWRYTLLLYVLSLPITLYTVGQALRYRDLRYLRERLGLHPACDKPGGLWIHAASVGEVNAVMPLLHALAARHPTRAITLTTVTPTGAQAAHRRLPAAARHRYLPLDWPSAVRRFVQRVRPACALIMETELWPHLYRTCSRADVPIIIINGRLSGRTTDVRPWLKPIYAATLKRVSAVLARSDSDRAAYVALGMPADRVHVIGNLKYAALRHGAPEPARLGRAYVLAASTHDDEELRLAELWRDLNHGDRLLMIAPRHPERLPAILNQLGRLQIEIAVRSRRQPITPTTQVYLADTFGELESFIAGADLVFMGGSLVPVGGHNLLEAARLGKAVIFGPHMQNFSDEARLLLENDAAAQVADTATLAECLEHLLHHPREVQAMGQRGRKLMKEKEGVVDDYITTLTKLCDALQDA